MNERESRDTWTMLSSGVAPMLMLPMVDVKLDLLER